MIIFKSHVKKELKVGLKEGGVLKKGDFQKTTTYQDFDVNV